METLLRLLEAWKNDDSCWQLIHDHLIDMGYPSIAAFHFRRAEDPCRQWQGCGLVRFTDNGKSLLLTDREEQAARKYLVENADEYPVT